MDTDTELIALLAKLRRLQEKLVELESQQANIKQELIETQNKANDVRKKSERRHAMGEQGD